MSSMTPGSGANFSIVLSLLASTLIGCSTGSPETRSPRYQAELSALQRNFDQLTPLGFQQLTAALQYFEQIDDFEGQWRAHTYLANWHSSNSNPEKALAHCQRAYFLAGEINQAEKIFLSSLQLGNLDRDIDRFRQALANAQTPLQHALALTHLQRFAQVATYLDQIENDPDLDSLGYIYYHYGKDKQDLNAILRANEYYRRADNIAGVIDSLFLAAQLSQAATGYAQRALLAASSANDELRTRAIERWLAARHKADPQQEGN